MLLRIGVIATLMFNTSCGSAVFYDDLTPLEDRDVWLEGPSNMVSSDGAEPGSSCSEQLRAARTQVLGALESSIARRRLNEANCLHDQAKILRTMHLASLGASFQGATGEDVIDLGEDLCAGPLRGVVATARRCDQVD